MAVFYACMRRKPKEWERLPPQSLYDLFVIERNNYNSNWLHTPRIRTFNPIKWHFAVFYRGKVFFHHRPALGVWKKGEVSASTLGETKKQALFLKKTVKRWLLFLYLLNNNIVGVSVAGCDKETKPLNYGV